MPTSSQSQILSAVDYHLRKKQKQKNYQEVQTNSYVRISIPQTKQIYNKASRRQSIDEKNTSIDETPSPSPPGIFVQGLMSDKQKDGSSLSRPTQKQDLLHMPVININHMTRTAAPRTSTTTTITNSLATNSLIGFSDNSQSRLIVSRPTKCDANNKGLLNDSSVDSFGQRRSSTDSEQDEQCLSDYRLKEIKRHPTLISEDEQVSPTSDFENVKAEEHSETADGKHSPVLNENARRLMMLGTIRPSKTFYKNLPDADINHLMTYFRRMKATNQRPPTEEINRELSEQHVEYKPKIFFDSTCVTKAHVSHLERLIEPYANEIRSKRAELIKLENPVRFIVKPVDGDQPLTTIPREYNDCLITLVSQSDPLHKSTLVTDLIPEKLCEDVKSNSLDISYFPGGINYDVPRQEIDENGQMPLETYQKLKKRLSNKKVWYFSGPPEKRPNSIIAIIPADAPFEVDHQCLLNAIYEHLKNVETHQDQSANERILSIEYVPLSCLLSSSEVSNQFIIDCDEHQTKQTLLGTPLKISLHKQSVNIEFQSHDELMQKEFEKFIKSEKYHELLKNHENGRKKVSANKKA